MLLNWISQYLYKAKHWTSSTHIWTRQKQWNFILQKEKEKEKWIEPKNEKEMRWLGWDHRHETLKLMIMIYKRRKRNLAEITLVRVEIVEVNLIFRISASLSRCRGWWKFCGWARRRRRLWTHYSSKDYFHSYLPAGLLGSIPIEKSESSIKRHRLPRPIIIFHSGEIHLPWILCSFPNSKREALKKINRFLNARIC